MDEYEKMLIERSQSQKATQCIIPFYLKYAEQTNPETESRLMVTREGPGERRGGGAGSDC